MPFSETVLRQLQEKVEILNGERGSPEKAALRRSDIKSLRDTITTVQETATSLKRTLDSLAETLETVRGGLDEASTALEALQEASGQNGTQITNLGTRASSLEEGLEEANNLLTNHGNRLQTVEDGLAEAVLTTTTLRGEFDVVEDDLADLHAAAALIANITITSTTVSAPPTAAQFNALLVDLQKVYTFASAVKSAVL